LSVINKIRNAKASLGRFLRAARPALRGRFSRFFDLARSRRAAIKSPQTTLWHDRVASGSSGEVAGQRPFECADGGSAVADAEVMALAR